MFKLESLQQIHVGTIEVLREVYRRQLQFSRGTAFKKAAQGHKEENVFLTDLKKAGLSLLDKICCYCSTGGAA